MRTTGSIAGSVLASAMAISLSAGCAHRRATPTASYGLTSGTARSNARAPVTPSIADDDLRRLTAEAYVYAYPLVLMDVTREVMTSVPAPTEGRAPINQFGHMRHLPDPASHDVVRLNLDTLYSTAWLDLSQGPIVLGVPDTNGRFYLMQMMDAYSNVFGSIGKRTTGTAAGAFAIVGPGFRGALPAGMQKIESPTNTVWILGRTQVNGTRDLTAVRRIQDRYTLTPLASYGTDYVPPSNVDVPAGISRAAPERQVEAMDARTFFMRFAEVQKRNPPPEADAAFLATLDPVGIRPGQSFDSRRIETSAGMVMGRGVGVARNEIARGRPDASVHSRGWDVFGTRGTPMGTYGTDYLTRAHVARFGLGANLAADAIYPNAKLDANEQPLEGTHTYRLHFAAGQWPPANAFWSVTVYDTEGFIAENALGRFALGDRDALRRNRDGSLDLYFGHESPGSARESNWLPTPPGAFEVTMRVYGPKETMLDGAWLPPGLERME